MKSIHNALRLSALFVVGAAAASVLSGGGAPQSSPMAVQTVGAQSLTSQCRDTFNNCNATCFDGGSNATQEMCVMECSIALETCVAGVVAENCQSECNATYEYCYEACPEDVIEQKEDCTETCDTTHLSGDTPNHAAYAMCYTACGNEWPECPHLPLCGDDAQEDADACYSDCVSEYNASDKTEADVNAFNVCVRDCRDENPHCNIDGSSTTGSTDGSTNGPTDTSTDVTTDGPSTTGTDTNTDNSTNWTTGNTDDGGTDSGTTTTIVNPTGPSAENYCTELYKSCGNTCDDQYIVDGVITDMPAYDQCNSVCADTYQACVGTEEPICEDGLGACYDTCETQHEFEPEDCDVYGNEEDTYDCEVRNADQREQVLTAKGRCIGACREAFSQCVEPERWFPKRPDLGPNKCTEIELTRENKLGMEMPDVFQSEFDTETGAGGKDNFNGMTRIPFMGPINEADLERYGAYSLFADVDVTDVTYTPFLTLLRQGVIRGYDDGTIRPDQIVSRAEIFKMIAHAQEKTVLQNCSAYYGDVQAGSWYDPYVRAAHDGDYIYAEGDNANPSGLISYEDMVLILTRAFDYDNGAGDDFIDFRNRLNQRNLLPSWLADETTANRWVTRRDITEVIYRYITMLDSGAGEYIDTMYLSVPDFGIDRLPMSRALVSHASSWLPASLGGGAYYTDTRPGYEGTPILMGHASFQDETEPALTIFREVSQQMVEGQQMVLDQGGTQIVYEVAERQVVSGMNVDALVDYGDADAVFFTCNIDPWNRVILKLKRIN